MQIQWILRVKICHGYYPSGNCRANICPWPVFISRATEYLAAFIRNKGWPPALIRKNSICLFGIVVGTIVLRKFGKASSAVCKINSHTVSWQVESKRSIECVRPSFERRSSGFEETYINPSRHMMRLWPPTPRGNRQNKAQIRERKMVCMCGR